jgi:YD repeat-containing protein
VTAGGRHDASTLAIDLIRDDLRTKTADVSGPTLLDYDRRQRKAWRTRAKNVTTYGYDATDRLISRHDAG